MWQEWQTKASSQVQQIKISSRGLECHRGALSWPTLAVWKYLSN